MKKSFLRVGMMLLMASVTLTSCQEFWDDLFGVESTPSTPPTPSTPSEPEDNTTLTKTEAGAEATVEGLADIADLLDQVKADIAAKGEEEYVFEIKNEGLAATATDNVIEVPKVEGSNINLNFSNGVSTETTLVIKAAETASDTPTEAVDALTITMPASEGLNLELDMPETTVTLEAASGEVIYDEVVATTAINTLHIGNGVTVKNLRIKGGFAKVKKGGKAETYVYAPTSASERLYVYDDSIAVGMVGETPSAVVKNEDGTPYPFKKLKVASSTSITFRNTNPMEKLTIIKGNTVAVISEELPVKVVDFANGDNPTDRAELRMRNSVSEKVENEKKIITAPSRLQHVTEMKGLFLHNLPSNSAQLNQLLASADSVAFAIYDAPNNMENCEFLCEYFELRAANTTTGSVKGCLFASKQEYETTLAINIPQQTEEISSFTSTLTNCKFGKTFKILAINIPEAEYNNYQVTIVINDCQVGGFETIGEEGRKMTSDDISFTVPEGVILKFVIDDTTYEPVWDDTTQKYTLKPVQ